MVGRFLAVAVAAGAIAAPQVARAQERVVGVARFGVAIPMRDGVKLVANIWRPDTVGHFPTILIRTPYIKTAQFRRYSLARYVREGYAVVLQDTRGRGDSEGEFDFYFAEGKDGFDTIEWIARQSWSNGRVGMDGGSYLGTVQWLAARERPPALKCIIPTAPSGRIFDEIPYLGGAFRLEWAIPWLSGVAGKVDQNELSELVDGAKISRQRPLAAMDAAFGRPMKLYQDFLRHDTLDDYWKRIQFTNRDFAKIDIPVLTVTGWFDGDQLGALFYWDGIERRRQEIGDRTNLIIGPWTHPQTYLGGAVKVGAYELGPSAIIDIQSIRVAFYDACLKQRTPKFDAPRVRVFVTGANRWVTGDRYPLPETQTKELFLRGGGSANSSAGDGRLAWEKPATEPSDTFSYDPRNPVPSKGITLDHRDLETRRDILVYSTEALTEPIEIVGRVFVKLFAATDATDTDFTAKILDVHPDGRAVILGPSETGVRRARYRNGYERVELLTPNRPEGLDLGSTGSGPVWSPDGKSLAFTARREGPGDLYRRLAASGGQDELLIRSPAWKIVTDWSPDGTTLIYQQQDLKSQWDLWALQLANKKGTPILIGQSNEQHGRLSPNGRLLAYTSDESGRFEVYVQPFPASGARWKVSADGGMQPEWRRDGRELFYVTGDRWLVALPVQAGKALQIGSAHPLFALDTEGVMTTPGTFHYSASADGQRFLVNTVVNGGTPTITVVINWTAVLGKP